MEQAKTTLKILWFVLVSSLFIYVYLVEAGYMTPHEVNQGPPNILFIAPLGFMALVNSLLAFTLPNYIKKMVDQASPEEKSKDPQSYFQRAVFTPAVLGWALSESVAVFGLVIVMVDGQIQIFYAFVAWSLLLFLIKRPNFSDF